jgi:hypothetical protein
MAKRRYSFDENKLEKFLKEARGKGHGVEYRPWLTIQDVSSIGLPGVSDFWTACPGPPACLSNSS